MDEILDRLERIVHDIVVGLVFAVAVTGLIVFLIFVIGFIVTKVIVFGSIVLALLVFWAIGRWVNRFLW